jgi:hypothetical protein
MDAAIPECYEEKNFGYTLFVCEKEINHVKITLKCYGCRRSVVCFRVTGSCQEGHRVASWILLDEFVLVVVVHRLWNLFMNESIDFDFAFIANNRGFLDQLILDAFQSVGHFFRVVDCYVSVS